jgi:PPOX class probable F420-dependent enzyme
MSFAMSRAEREAFLADVHIGVLTVAAGNDRDPLAVPVWYSYSPGGIVSVITGQASQKARAVAASGRASLCAQLETPPYKYVTVGGPAVIDQCDQAELVAMARRYLGREGGDAYVAANPNVGNVVVRITPERWLSVDYAKRAAGPDA